MRALGLVPPVLAALAGTAPALAQEAAPAVTAAPPQTTVVYVYPTSPSTFVPVAGLPSFVVMPGSPLPEIGTYVVHAVPLPALPAVPVATTVAASDLDCAHFEGTVRIVPPDVHGLDKDGDGIGCEPEERVGTGR